MNFAYPLTIRRVEKTQAATTDQALTAIEISGAVFLSHQSALSYIRNLVAAGSMHIEDWRVIKFGVRAALYRWGAGTNKAKPPPKDRNKIERERMKRVRKDPEAYALYLSKQRARYIKDCAGKKPNSWFGALPGSRAIQRGAQP